MEVDDRKWVGKPTGVYEMVATEERPATMSTVGVKTPHARLLDMLAGWSEYVEADVYRDAEGVNDRIADLYQEAGALGLEPLNPVDANSDEVIRAFIIDRVLPVLTAA